MRMPKILVIDDDAMIRNTIARILRAQSFDVLLAEDGVKGLASFRHEKPDLVLTDILMPDKEGIETISEIKREAAHAKIIAMSGGGRVGNADFLTMARKLGASDVISKPFVPQDLVDLIKHCLDEP
jgi:DNA-binding response OmpR family regulator